MATAAVSSSSLPFLLLLAGAAAVNLLLLPSVHACTLEFTKCTEYTTTDTVAIRKVEVNPFPVLAGKPVTFNISANAAGAIPADATVHFALSQRLPKGSSYSDDHVGDVGGYALQGSTTVVGDFTISQTFNLPSNNDRALQVYTCQMDIMQWNQLPSTMPTCINFDFIVFPH